MHYCVSALVEGGIRVAGALAVLSAACGQAQDLKGFAEIRSKFEGKERSALEEYLVDLCALTNHPKHGLKKTELDAIKKEIADIDVRLTAHADEVVAA